MNVKRGTDFWKASSTLQKLLTHQIQATSIRSDGGIGTNFSGVVHPNTNHGLRLSLHATSSPLIIDNATGANMIYYSGSTIDFSGSGSTSNGGYFSATAYGNLTLDSSIDINALPGSGTAENTTGGVVELISETGLLDVGASSGLRTGGAAALPRDRAVPADPLPGERERGLPGAGQHHGSAGDGPGLAGP